MTARAEIDGRRLSSAGRPLVVILLALVFGLLLDARGLHKSAFNQPAGTAADGGAGAHRRARERERRAPARPAALLAQGGDRAVG